MSATLGTYLQELEPGWSIEMVERQDKVAEESSNGWNNAGTGHSALAEMNYTPEKNGAVDIAKAIEINEAFQISRQFWAWQVNNGVMHDPRSFIPYRFRKWVTSEVLPKIRKTGRYVREELSPADKAQKVVASFMPAILEAMKEGDKPSYSYPLKPGYREMIHCPEGVVGLAEKSLLMNLLQQLDEDGHDVAGAAAEFTTMVSYIVGVSRCLQDIRSHAQYINKNASEF